MNTAKYREISVLQPLYVMRYATLRPATLLKVTLLHGCFSHILNCTYGSISRKASHTIAMISEISGQSSTVREFPTVCESLKSCFANTAEQKFVKTCWVF